MSQVLFDEEACRSGTGSTIVSTKTSDTGRDVNKSRQAAQNGDAEDAPQSSHDHVQVKLTSDQKKDSQGDVLNVAPDCTDSDDERWNRSRSNPMNWTSAKKCSVVALLAMTNFIAAMASSAFEPALPVMMRDFHSSSGSLESLTVSIYLVGYFIGPIIVAPACEIYGRVPLLAPSFLLLLVGLAICGSSNSLALFVVFRIFMGFAGVTFALVGFGVVADIVPKKNIGLATTVLISGLNLGPCLGPIMGGFVAQRTSWRWVFWSLLIAQGALTVWAAVGLRETYRARIEQRSGIASKAYNAEPQTAPRKTWSLKEAWNSPWTRPFRMLIQVPSVTLFALYGLIFYGYQSILFSTLGTVFQDAYGFSSSDGGLVYLSMVVGYSLGQISIGTLSDKYMERKQRKRGSRSPEDRLPLLLIGAVTIPVAFVWYGWTVQHRTHWIAPAAASALAAFGMTYTWLPVQVYLVDVYGSYSASANGACGLLRSLCGAFLPLAANPLYDSLGYGWGNTLLAFVGLIYIPLTLLLLRYGQAIRNSAHPKTKGLSS